MKEILLSIQSKWVERIINGENTIEIKKTKPRTEKLSITRSSPAWEVL